MLTESANLRNNAAVSGRCSVKKPHRVLFPFYGQINRSTVKRQSKFTLLDIKPPTLSISVRTEENISTVSASVNDGHQLSFCRGSQQLGLCYATMWKILRKNLGV